MADIEKIAIRPREYLSGTGLPWLTAGLIFVIQGGSALLQQSLPKESLTQLVVQWIGVFCCGGLFYAASLLKRRLVFPRGGYVVPRARPAYQVILFGSFPVAVACFALIFPGRLIFSDGGFIPAGLAMWVAITLLVDGWRRRQWPMMWCSLYFAGLGALLWWIPGTTYARLSMLQLASGLLMVATGAVALKRFLRTNPILAEPMDE